MGGGSGGGGHRPHTRPFSQQPNLKECAPAFDKCSAAAWERPTCLHEARAVLSADNVATTRQRVAMSLLTDASYGM